MDMPQWVIDHQAEWDKWESSVAVWLGLDPARVFNLRVDNEGHWTRVSWESDEQALPTKGQFQHWDASGDMDGIMFTGWVVLDHQDAEAMDAAVGPMPSDLISAEDKVKLRALFSPSR